MASFTLPPQRIQLLKTVERAFTRAGWEVVGRHVDDHDFKVTCHDLCFLIKCLDETRITYESEFRILTSLERYAREVHSLRNRQLIVVLDWNFLSIPLDRLIDRRIFILTVDNLTSVTSLAAVGDRCPETLDERQTYLLERCVAYAVFLSQLYRKEGDYAASIKWARHAVEHSAGYTHAYLHLFEILKDTEDYDAAAELGETIIQYRSDDPQVLRGMQDLARRRGDKAEAAKWEKRLTEQPTTPRNLNDILAKQRAQNGTGERSAAAAPDTAPPPTKSGLARLFRGFRRQLGQ
jgi:tetratricopeptide (TPR) repeat protein